MREWWHRWPSANVGIVTGAASGLVVIDIDPRHGGQESLAALMDEHGELPESLDALTGSGGMHIYLSHPGDVHIPNSAGTLAPGVDIRADGGYVIGVPSVHASGFLYEWDQCDPGRHRPSAIPPWLLERIVKPEPAARMPLSVEFIAPRRASSYSVAVLRREAAEVASTPEGGRNARLNKAAWSVGRLLAAGGLLRADAERILLDAALAAGLGAHEAEKTIASGLNAGQHEPRHIPTTPPRRRKPRRARA